MALLLHETVISDILEYPRQCKKEYATGFKAQLYFFKCMSLLLLSWPSRSWKAYNV